MTAKKNIDKIVKLLDLLDEHIKEQNCQHNSKELFEQYDRLTPKCS